LLLDRLADPAARWAQRARGGTDQKFTGELISGSAALLIPVAVLVVVAGDARVVFPGKVFDRLNRALAYVRFVKQHTLRTLSRTS